MSQKPSVGRIVHYHDEIVPGRVLAAIVTEVLPSGEKVGLTLFRPGSAPEPKLFATTYGTDPGCWSWPERV